MSGKHQEDQPPRRRTPAERTTLAASLSVLVAVAGLLVYQEVISGHRPPAFEVAPLLGRARSDGGVYYLPIEVRNTGDATAEDVRVRVGFVGEPAAPRDPPAEFEVRFIAGGEVYRAEVVLARDPAAGGLWARVVSFHSP